MRRAFEADQRNYLKAERSGDNAEKGIPSGLDETWIANRKSVMTEI